MLGYIKSCGDGLRCRYVVLRDQNSSTGGFFLIRIHTSYPLLNAW